MALFKENHMKIQQENDFTGDLINISKAKIKRFYLKFKRGLFLYHWWEL